MLTLPMLQNLAAQRWWWPPGRSSTSWPMQQHALAAGPGVDLARGKPVTQQRDEAVAVQVLERREVVVRGRHVYFTGLRALLLQRDAGCSVCQLVCPYEAPTGAVNSAEGFASRRRKTSKRAPFPAHAPNYNMAAAVHIQY